MAKVFAVLTIHVLHKLMFERRFLIELNIKNRNYSMKLNIFFTNPGGLVSFSNFQNLKNFKCIVYN